MKDRISGQNAGAPNCAMEEGEVSACGHDKLAAGVGWHQWTQVVCFPRLARCRNIVVFAFHGHESRRAHRREVHGLTAGQKLTLPDRAFLIDVAN